MYMIELLILYILNSREKTIYALRRDIIERFGMVTKPSLGTVYPALKRLLAKDAVKFSTKYTEGGKKFTYYTIAQNGKKVFKEMFFEGISQNPTIFHSHLSARLLTISMLEKQDREEFLNELSQKLELQKIEVQNSIDNFYQQYDEWQKGVISETLNELNSLCALIGRLKIYS